MVKLERQRRGEKNEDLHNRRAGIGLPGLRAIHRGPGGGAHDDNVNHVGFKVRDVKDVLDNVAARHFTIQAENPTKENLTQAFTPQAVGKVNVATEQGLALEANGVKLDTPYRKIPQMGFAVAFRTDPRETRIELTERSAASPSAQSLQPERQ
jgi:hypothetical protein